MVINTPLVAKECQELPFTPDSIFLFRGIAQYPLYTLSYFGHNSQKLNNKNVEK